MAWINTIEHGLVNTRCLERIDSFPPEDSRNSIYATYETGDTIVLEGYLDVPERNAIMQFIKNGLDTKKGVIDLVAFCEQYRKDTPFSNEYSASRENSWTRYACVRNVDGSRLPDTSTLCLSRGGAIATARENDEAGVGLYNHCPVVGTTVIRLEEIGDFVLC